MPTKRARLFAVVGAAALMLPIVASAAVAIVGWANDDGSEPTEIVSSGGPTFTSLDELVAASDVVVVATVADVADGRTLTAAGDPEAGIRTRLVELSVQQTLAGEAGEPLIVEEASQLLDGTPVVVDGMELLAEGDQAVWFLVAGGTPEAPYHAVVNGQSRYVVVGDTLQPAGDDPLSRQLAALGVDGLVDQLS